MANPDSSLRPGGTKKLELQDSLKAESNLSGLKHVLHGASYQLKLGMIVSLANAKKSLDPANAFSFEVAAEDPTAGKFDDIVYTFQDGEKTGILKIQVKHKLGSPARDITLSEFTTGKDSSNPFAILKYFSSFCDQEQSSTDLEGFVICTNADINDEAKNLWKTVEPAVTNDSVPTLDSYVSSLFDGIEGKYYQLDYKKLWAADGTFSNLYQLLRKCSKRARLAKLLIEAIKPKKNITSNSSLFKEYRQAILGVLDRNESTANDSYGFTKEFLVLSSSNSKSGYEAFRKEFEEQYRQEFKIDGCVWDDLKLKRLYVSKDYLSDEKNTYSSSDSFPNDNVDECFKSFCERLRLVCGTLAEHELDDAITKIWKNLHNDDNHLVPGQLKGYNEENMATDRLFKTNFDWLMDPFAKPLHSEDIRKDLENIKGTLAYMKLESISDKLRKKFLGSPFRISAKTLQDSELHDQIDSESILVVEAFDIQFGIRVLLDILELQSKDYSSTLFLDDYDFSSNLHIVEAVFRCNEPSRCLIIICGDAFKTVKSTVWKWKKDLLKGSTKQVFLIRKTDNISADLDCFRLCDLTEESWEQFQNENITLCGTTISPPIIFQDSFKELPIEELIKLWDWGKQMEENNEISTKYREIESTYVHRPWADEENEQKVENGGLKMHSNFYKRMQEFQWEGIDFNEMTKSLKEVWTFYDIFGHSNNSVDEHEPIVNDEGKKVLILFGEAGHGKSTNLTWLAWHLRKRNPSSWVIRCNLSDHCIDLKPFIKDLNNRARKGIDETEAMRVLYKLVCSSLQLKREMAEICSNCLDISDGKVSVNEVLTKQHGLSLNNSIQLMVFKEKFNAGELMCLLDGFDEIAPSYKKVVLKILSHFAQFKGVRKLYITSRPYGFRAHFLKAFKYPLFFVLEPLSLPDKASMLYKMMKENWHNGNIDDDVLSDFYKSLCLLLLSSLGEMSDVSLNLMMTVDILRDHIYHNEQTNIEVLLTTSNTKLIEITKDFSKASFIVEEFLKVRIRHLLYDKNGADKNVAYKPLEMEKLEKAIDEVKMLHGLMSIWILFSSKERRLILSDTEVCEAKKFLYKLHEGGEKTGIVHSTHDGRVRFIHRSFVEYLAAWWIIQRQSERKHQGSIKIINLDSFWFRERRKLRTNIDIILAKRNPLHMAIIEKDWETVETLLSTNPQALYERDEGERTALHLIALYYDFKQSWPLFLPDSVESEIINLKEKIFGWTTLDYAFCKNKLELIFYLLHHGASINAEVLYDQKVSPRQSEVDTAINCARCVMQYLSHEVIEYESHDACQKMKQFCNKMIHYLLKETSWEPETLVGGDFGIKMFIKAMITTKERDAKNEYILQHVIENDAVWMLDSIIQQENEGCSSTFSMACWEFAFESKSMFVLKYLMESYRSALTDKVLWHCAVYAALKGYKIEFKYFFDLYCSRFEIKDFQPCSIEKDEPCNIFYLSESYAIDKVCEVLNEIRWIQLETPVKIINPQILCLLVTCVVTVRPSMLRYLIKSLKLKLDYGLVYLLAKITNVLILKIPSSALITPVKPRIDINLSKQPYECLLNLASTIRDDEANTILHHAIASNIFEFSKCLIERYNINFHIVDDVNGWNVFHTCVSYITSSLDKLIETMKGTGSGRDSTYGVRDWDSSYINGGKTDLFCYMLEKERNMDCFGNCDKEGRSILYLAIENVQIDIVRHILAQKLGLNHFDEIENLNVDAIPNLTFCCRAIHEISKSVEEKEYKGTNELYKLAKQIARISLTKGEELQESHRSLLILQEDAKVLYEIAMKCRSLTLMYYLNREFAHAIPPLIYNAEWLACIAKSLSPAFLVVTRWLLNPNEVNENANLYEVVEKCDTEDFDMMLVNLEKLVSQVEGRLSTNRSVEEVCKMKLLALTVCLKRQSMIMYYCENLHVNINWKDLIDIMVIAHGSYCYVPGTKYHKSCAFDWSDFVPVYKYLFERTSNVGEVDADGGNVLHLAVQSGLGCMAKFLMKHNIVNVTAINEQNGWNIFHYYASRKSCWDCCYTKNDALLTCIIKHVLEITSDDFSPSSFTEIQKNKIKELCFTINGGRKNVIHVAVAAGNIGTVKDVIELRLGIDCLDNYKIKNSREYSRFRECYDELCQIALEMQTLSNSGNSSLMEKYNCLLRSVAKPTQRFCRSSSGRSRPRDRAKERNYRSSRGNRSSSNSSSKSSSSKSSNNSSSSS